MAIFVADGILTLGNFVAIINLIKLLKQPLKILAMGKHLLLTVFLQNHF